MNSDINPYSLFGLSESFTKKELQSAYFEMALITHPDRGGTKEEMHTVIKAYEYLKSCLISVNQKPKLSLMKKILKILIL